MELSTEIKNFIQSKSILDKGVFNWDAWHNEDNTIVVESMNYKGPGFDRDLLYTIKLNGEKQLVTTSSVKALDKYVELMLVKYKKEIEQL